MNIRSDFPFFQKNPDLIYLDSACTSLKPFRVIDAERSYYEEFGACAGRSSHKFGRRTSDKIEECREKIAKFVNAEIPGIIFTKNTTEGLNLVINGINYTKRRKVVTTDLEHHAVLLPLMRLRDRGAIRLEIVKSNSGINDEEAWKKAIDHETRLVMTHVSSNTTGIVQNIELVGKIAHEYGALICIDGAQSVPHLKTDLKKTGIDFLCFSSHKMLGPTGVGAICMKRELMKEVNPLTVGGGTVKTVSLETFEFAEDHSRFEAGIQNYSGIFGFAEACNYLSRISFEKIQDHEEKLKRELFEALHLNEVTILGDEEANRSPLYSFNIKGAKPHDLALMLDKENIAVRSGFFCAQPALEVLGAKQGAVRASAYIYNTVEEIGIFGEKLEKIRPIYS